MIFELARDYSTALEVLPRQHPDHCILDLMEDAILRDIHFIDLDPCTLFQCMWNHGSWSAGPDLNTPTFPGAGINKNTPRQKSKLSTFLEHWRSRRNVCPNRWVQSRMPPVAAVGSELKHILHGYGNKAVGFDRTHPYMYGVGGQCIKVWDLNNGGRLSAEMATHNMPFSNVAQGPDGLLVACKSEGSVEILSIVEQVIRCTLPGANEWFQDFELCQDGSRLLSISSPSGEDPKLRLWDLANGTVFGSLRGRYTLSEIWMSADGTLLAIETHPGEVSLYGDICILNDNVFGRIAALPCRPEHGMACTTFSPDKKYVAINYKEVGRQNRSCLDLYNIDAGKRLHTVPECSRAIFSPDSKKILVTRASAAIVIDIETGKAMPLWTSDPDAWKREPSIECMVFSQDGMRIALGLADGGIRILYTVTGQLRELRGHSGRVVRLSFAESPPGRLASADSEGQCRVWDCDSAATSVSRHGHHGTIRAVALSPRADRLAIAWGRDSGYTGRLQSHSATTGEMERILWENIHCLCVSFSEDGKRLACGSSGFARQWDPNSGDEMEPLMHGLMISIRGITYFSQDEKVALVGRQKRISTQNGILLITDPGYAWEPECIDLESDRPSCLASTRDGRLIAYGTENGLVRIRDMENRCCAATLEGHRDRVEHLCFSDDHARVASVSADGTTRLWEWKAKRCMEVLDGMADPRVLVAGVEEYPLLALAVPRETVIQCRTDGSVLARYPVSLCHLVTYPDGKTWAGADQQHLHIISLQGNAFPCGVAGNEQLNPCGHGEGKPESISIIQQRRNGSRSGI